MKRQHLINQRPPESTLTLLKGIWSHLSQRRRFQVGLLLLVMLASGAAELASLGTLLPFLQVLSDPESLWKQPLVRALASNLGFQQTNHLVLLVTLAFATAAVLAALVRLTNLWLNGLLVAAVGSDLSCEAYRRTLYQPYGVHVGCNSSSLISGTTTQINITVGALNSLLQLITSTIVAVSLLAGLLLIDAPVALSASVLFGTAYILIVIISRRELRLNGQKIAEASNQQVKALQEGLGAIRDVLLNGSQTTYLRIYQQADRPQRQLQAKNSFIGAFPRYALEALGLVAIALFGGIVILQHGSGDAWIPLLGVLALGAQRLLPALQQIYSGWASLKSCNAAIYAVLVMLKQPLPPIFNVTKPLQIKKSICLEDVHFSYEQNQPEVLRGLDLEIRDGERIGLIGPTGSGKSTMVDLLMGLLEPTTGRLLVDGVDLHDPHHPELLAAWRATISHVPQSIYLADTTIAENIAFGVPTENIDMALVKQAASQAQISDFIESCTQGYDSSVGERGIRLSGGQRQRIGIARALYKNCRVLVLDEATSALDIVTEKALMDAVDKLNKSLTILMIAHRLSTVESCDRVIMLSDGMVSADGPPNQVLSASI